MSAIYRLMRAIYVVLGAPGALPIESFANPVELLRIFNYPPHNSRCVLSYDWL